MTLNKLASMIAKAEGKKSQASIGDIREILKILIRLDAELSVANRDQALPLTLLLNESQKVMDKLMKKAG